LKQPRRERPSAEAVLRDPRIWPDDDYAIVDGTTLVGRIYRELISGEPKWLWAVQQIPETGPGRPIAPPNKGVADTLDQAKAAFKKRYMQLRERFGRERLPSDIR
jgi:hypothetical protein